MLSSQQVAEVSGWNRNRGRVMRAEFVNEARGILPERAAIGLKSIEHEGSEHAERSGHRLRYGAKRVQQRRFHAAILRQALRIETEGNLSRMYSDFENSPGLREQIETALEERDLQQMCNDDLPQIERLLRFWRSHGRPELYFRIVR